MESNKIKALKLTAAIVLLIVAMLLLLSLVGITNPELSVDETVGQWVWFDKTTIVAAGLILFVILVLRQKILLPEPAYCFSLALMIWGGIEAIWGLRQLYGFAASGHARYALTGSFFNPGPYAGYLAMVLPLCLDRWMNLRFSWKLMETDMKIEKCIVVVAGLCILCVLPATMSRSAWLAAWLACLWVYAVHAEWGKRFGEIWRLNRGRMLAGMVAALCLLIISGWLLFSLKPDSARGRLFMWKITCHAIAKKPMIGYGPGNFALAYGDAQEKYFAKGNYAEWEERVAGSPEYAFNEYLQAATEYGIPMTVLALLVIALCWLIGIREERFGVCGAVISLMVFSFSSYPLQLPVFIVTSVGLLLSCVVNNRPKSWALMAVIIVVYGVCRLPGDSKRLEASRDLVNVRMLYRVGAYEAALEDYERLYPLLKEKSDFLFEYGHCLHKTDKVKHSNQILNEAMRRSNDPMILNIIGKNCLQMGDYWGAEDWFIRAIHRLPGRIYPYYLLAKLYAKPGFEQPDKFEAMKQIVWTKEPKVNSTAIREMREELEKINIVSQ